LRFPPREWYLGENLLADFLGDVRAVQDDGDDILYRKLVD